MKNSGIENCNLNKGVINLSSLLCMNAPSFKHICI